MNGLPFTNIQYNDMLDNISTNYSIAHSTSYLGTNNVNLFQIDTDLNISHNLSKKTLPKFRNIF